MLAPRKAKCKRAYSFHQTPPRDDALASGSQLGLPPLKKTFTSKSAPLPGRTKRETLARLPSLLAGQATI